ncbi:Myosin head (motor domain) family protein [Babesia bovis T2Bo]|uniref:Myosin-A n=1 Tax=Babesia bovis TaxID=5865 RepID=A7ASN6_BABBO|nr:Myosin head (motor domain) family protein [Babesia bovis T2Bo]EDO07555.1 Myosin head (motor domain) family protein [Babesia bovis T2Bo]|eukprot:XP_001611123.1 myosin B [Babesia bovis T2Bo]
MAGTAASPAVERPKAGGKGRGNHFSRQESRVENMEYMIGQQIWIKIDTDDLFALATVKSFTEDKVSVSYNGTQMTVSYNDCLNTDVMNVPLDTHDLVKLRHANSAVVSDILRTRFMSDMIYTYAGKLLVALNPFRLIPNLYGAPVIERYRRCDTSLGFPSDAPPHVYAVAQCVLNGLIRSDQCQSCIVSGESGAGKTETAKQLMDFFAYGPSQGTDSVQKVVLGSNVVLEAFGNAKTLRNNNSSRFGKFVKILVAPDGGLKGGIICSYMLELSRIEFQSDGERNYHIFYQCLKGLSSSEKEKFGFRSIESYRFLNGGKCCDAPGIDDVKEFAAVRRELQQLFPDNGFEDCMRCISGILLCGNIEFKEVTSMGVENAAAISNTSDFEQMCSLLGFNADQAERALATKVVTIQGDSITSPVTVAAAEVNVRALAKDLYGALFEFCIDKINSIIQFDDVAKRWIGILDIYGFEFFEKNTYEQLLINYANERLQQYFINRVFASEIAEYDAEGIDHSSIHYTDNSEVLLVLDKPNCSIFSFLEEQCLIQTGSSEKFTASCKSKIKNELFVPAQGAVCKFTIVHTATAVTYNTEEFVPKNKHKLSIPIVELLQGSSNSIVRMSAERIPAETGNMKGKFLGSKFHSSIGALMRTLNDTESHFIRCIKTNQQKQPKLYETGNVYGQLISLSIIEAIQTIHRGFAYRATFEKFLSDNDFLNSYANACSSEGDDLRLTVEKILQNLGIPVSDYQLGKNKIFIKKNGWMLLEKAFLQYTQTSKPLSAALYSIYRVWRNRNHLENSRTCIVRIQSNVRRYLIQASTLIAKERLHNFVGLVAILDFVLNEDPRISAVITIQSCVRMRICRRRYLLLLEAKRAQERQIRVAANLKRLRIVQIVFSTCRYLQLICESRRRDRAATVIASCWRMHVAIRQLNNLRLHRLTNFAATLIQKHIRGFLQRRAYNETLSKIPFIVRLQSAFRMCLTINHLDPHIGERLRYTRLHLRMMHHLQLFQAVVKSVLCHRRLDAAQDAVLCLQKYGWSRGCHEEFHRIRDASSTITSYWRRERLHSVVRVERERLYREADRQLYDGLSCEETTCAHRMFENGRNSSNRRLLPVHVHVNGDYRGVYPGGWSSCLERLQSKGGTHTSGITSMGMCDKYSVVVLDDRDVYGFGANAYTDLNRSGSTACRLLASVPNPLKVAGVHCGHGHTILHLSDGSLYGWGDNSHGQCGVAATASTVGSPTLIRMPMRSGSPVRIRSVSAGSFHNCASSEDGTVFIWGGWRDLNLPCFGEDLSFPAELPSGSWSIGEHIDSVYCGHRVCYLLTNSGKLLSFGSTANGQLGHEWPERGYPRVIHIPGIVSAVSCGGNFTIAVTDRSEVYVFGTVQGVRHGREVRHVFASPECLLYDRASLGSPIMRSSVGYWDCNVLTEDGLIWAWSYLVLDDGCTRPILYRYSCLSDIRVLDVITAYSSKLSVTSAVV